LYFSRPQINNFIITKQSIGIQNVRFLVEYLKTGLETIMLNPKIDTKLDSIAIARRVIEQEMQGLSTLSNRIDNQFNIAIDLIFSLSGRVMLCGIGKSGHIARKIAATLASTGTPAAFVHASEASHGDMGMITDKDVVLLLSNSGESGELNNIVEYCKRFAIPIIGITSNPNSTLAKASYVNLVLPKISEASDIDAPTTSTTMMLALGDAMAVVLHEGRGFTKADFKVFHPGGKLGAKLLRVADIMHVGEALPIVHEEVQMIDAVLEITKKRLGYVGIINTEFNLVGVFTDGDLRRHLSCDLKTTAISEVMTKSPLITVNQNNLASEALGIMNRKAITALFVTEANKPIGIIHMHDILRARVA